MLEKFMLLLLLCLSTLSFRLMTNFVGKSRFVLKTELENPTRGTRDFYPPDQRLQTWLFDGWRKYARKYGFEEYSSPVVENAELFSQNSGSEIESQLYLFSDKSGRQLCLRPEQTPSLLRMIRAKRGVLKFPLKWFSIPQCWRYERTTKGRKREHYQWNADIVGVPNIEAEAELLSLIISYLKHLKFTAEDVQVHINNRRIIDAILVKLDINNEWWLKIYHIIDKMKKITRSELINEFKNQTTLHDNKIAELIQYLEINSLGEMQKILTQSTNNNNTTNSTAVSSSLSSNNSLQLKGLNDLQHLFKLLQGYNITNWCQYDSSIVRGLNYYTDTIFEIYDCRREYRAICGGGRYNTRMPMLSNEISVKANTIAANLSDTSFKNDSNSSDVYSNGDDINDNNNIHNNTVVIPVVGFGFGDVVIMELLKSKKLLPDHLLDDDGNNNNVNPIDIVLYAMSKSLRNKASEISVQLRERTNYTIDTILEQRVPKAAFHRANQLKAKLVVMLAINEHDQNQAIIKDMSKQQQYIVSYEELMDKIVEMLK